MRKINLVLLVIVLAAAAIAAGAGIRYFVEKSRNSIQITGDDIVSSHPEQFVRSDVVQSGEYICVPLIDIETDLGTKSFTLSHEQPNLFLVRRSGEESFFIVLPDPEEDHREKYSIPEESDFVIDSLGVGVNEIVEERQISYFVDYEPPFFVAFVEGTPDDEAAREDVQVFLDTMRPGTCSAE